MWQVWSQNDGTSSAIIQNDFDTYVGAFITLAHSLNAIPIIMTHMPTVNITTSAVDNTRLSVNNQVRALASNDVLVFDIDPVMSDGASPARIIPAYTTDGAHPTAAGKAAEGEAFSTFLANYLSTH